jgi:hypothetical protein
MIKVLNAAIIGCILFLSACVNTSTTLTQATMITPFGAGPGCKTKGICLIQDSVQNATSVTAYYGFDEKLNMLTISFHGKELETRDPEKIKQFGGQPNYIFDETWKAPDALNKKLKVKKPIIIEKGQENKLEYFPKRDSFVIFVHLK